MEKKLSEMLTMAIDNNLVFVSKMYEVFFTPKELLEQMKQHKYLKGGFFWELKTKDEALSIIDQRLRFLNRQRDFLLKQLDVWEREFCNDLQKGKLSANGQRVFEAF